MRHRTIQRHGKSWNTAAAGELSVLQVLDCLEMLVDQASVGQQLQMPCWLEFGE